MQQERRAVPDRRNSGDRRQDSDWLYLGPERRQQAEDRRRHEDDRRQH